MQPLQHFLDADPPLFCAALYMLASTSLHTETSFSDVSPTAIPRRFAIFRLLEFQLKP